MGVDSDIITCFGMRDARRAVATEGVARPRFVHKGKRGGAWQCMAELRSVVHDDSQGCADDRRAAKEDRMTLVQFAISAAMSLLSLVTMLAFLAALKSRGFDAVGRLSGMFAPTLTTGGTP